MQGPQILMMFRNETEEEKEEDGGDAEGGGEGEEEEKEGEGAGKLSFITFYNYDDPVCIVKNVLFRQKIQK